MAGDMLKELTGYAELAYRAALVYYCGQRNSCVMTASALAEFLREHDLPAELVRLEAHTFGPNGASGMGWDGDGTRRPKAGPGGWWGHLGVEVVAGDDLYVMDPTIGQSRVADLTPLVFEAPEGWKDGETQHWQYEDGYFMSAGYERDDTTGYHRRYHTQHGWKSRPESRPSHWRGVVELMNRYEEPPAVWTEDADGILWAPRQGWRVLIMDSRWMRINDLGYYMGPPPPAAPPAAAIRAYNRAAREMYDEFNSTNLLRTDDDE